MKATPQLEKPFLIRTYPTTNPTSKGKETLKTPISHLKVSKK